MKKYKVIDISENQLEETVRKAPGLIEDGLRYVDHQKKVRSGLLDVLFVDSGNALVVAELKVTEDDMMLVQGIDYYDNIITNIEGFARAYKNKNIDPTQKTRLFLISPSFSVSLLNRCKWIDIPISLFTFQSIAFEDRQKDIIIVFKEITIPSRLQPVEVYTIEQRLDYITDNKVKRNCKEFLKEIQEWDKNNILIEALKYYISIKVSGKVFSYLGPRRKYFIIYTCNSENKWVNFPIKQIDDLEEVKILLKINYEKFK